MVQQHPYHLVDPSPWPFFTALGVFRVTTGGVRYRHQYATGGALLFAGVCFVSLCRGRWWRDVVREATFQGHHTRAVQTGLREGRLLFISSEVRFFFGFFWAFFWSALSPNVELGGVWPPQGIEVLNAFEVPLLNTAILLTSGATCTWAHHAIVEGNKQAATLALWLTVALGVAFSACQFFEYQDCSFSIADGIYGSTFFRATGFHGFHVLIGTTFLLVCSIRVRANHFTKEHHFGFEAAAWYWHFVDVVWLFLFVTIYYWGGA